MALTIAAQPIRDPFAGATKAACDRLLTPFAEAKDGEIVAVEFAGTFTIEGGGSAGNAALSFIWTRARGEGGEERVKAVSIADLDDAEFDRLAPDLLRLQVDGWPYTLGEVSKPLDIEDQTAAISCHDSGTFSLEDYYKRPLRRAKGRNYNLFSLLSDVRTNGRSPMTTIMTSGIPEDGCGWAIKELDGDSDLHSPGWATLAHVKKRLGRLKGEKRELLEQWLEHLQLAAAEALAGNEFLVEVITTTTTTAQRP